MQIACVPVQADAGDFFVDEHLTTVPDIECLSVTAQKWRYGPFRLKRAIATDSWLREREVPGGVQQAFNPGSGTGRRLVDTACRHVGLIHNPWISSGIQRD
jgi:hypothetical protein